MIVKFHERQLDFESAGHVDRKGIKDCCELCLVASVSVSTKKIWNINDNEETIFFFLLMEGSWTKHEKPTKPY